MSKFPARQTLALAIRAVANTLNVFVRIVRSFRELNLIWLSRQQTDSANNVKSLRAPGGRTTGIASQIEIMQV